MSNTATLQYLANTASKEVKGIAGVTIPPQVFLEHFAAENSQGPLATYNYAGLKSGNTLLSFGSNHAFLNAYLSNYVLPDINGAISKGAIAKGQTLNSGEFAAALQYGGAGPYCAGKCGSFYQQATKYQHLYNNHGIIANTWDNLIKTPGNILNAANTTFDRILLVAAIAVAAILVFNKLLNGAPLRAAQEAAKSAGMVAMAA